MRNLYDILAFSPITEKEKMPALLESLTERLVRSGRLRIEAEERSNFLKLSLPHDDVYATFSRRELEDRSLLPMTRQKMHAYLCHAYSGARLDEKIEWALDYLLRERVKTVPVPEDVEYKVARLIVQSAHPAVIQMMLWDEVDVYVSFEHSIGGLLDIQSWQTVGESSGMQTDRGREYKIYVACGGDPFREASTQEPWHGEAAMKQCIVIAAQEIGHYSDLRHDHLRNPVGRFSADLLGYRAAPEVKRARHEDLEALERLKAALEAYGLDAVVQQERVRPSHPNHALPEYIPWYDAPRYWRLLLAREQCYRRLREAGISWVPRPKLEHNWASHIRRMLGDMRFNLEPQADAYDRRNREEQEAIWCIEALARVPQQVMKWGHPATRACMPNLYRIYYKEVIPNCIKEYEQVTGQRYHAL